MKNATIQSKHCPSDMDPLLQRLTQRINSIPTNAGRSKRMKVDVTRRGKWFILKGNVSSYRMKLKLFSWVPKIHGEQHIVDKLRIRNAYEIEG